MSDFIKRVQALAGANPVEILKKIFERKDVQDLVQSMNIDQLQVGKRSDGVELPPYSKRSVKKFGKPNGPILLYDTGAFYESIHIVVDASGVNIAAEPQKENTNLFNAYGLDIIGLDDAHKQELSEFIKPIFKQELLKLAA